MNYRHFNINQSNSSTRAFACGLAFSVCQSIDDHIIYLCYEYQLIWTYNEWFIGISILANQIQAHVHARAVWYFLVHQSIDVHIMNLFCEYQLIWSYNEWFISLLVLANQLPAHAHARVYGQFWTHRSIKCLNFCLRHKYQANPMKNNEVIAQWNVPII
jgi:hypothetical protein